MTRVHGRRGHAALDVLGLLALVAATATACNATADAVRARRLAPVRQGEVRYIAILPFESDPEVQARPREPGEELRPEPPAVTLRRALRDAMHALPGWQLKDDLVTDEAVRALHGDGAPVGVAQAAAVGRLLGVDAVVRGVVRRFEGRVGAEYAAQHGALVDFTVDLVAFPLGETVWHAEYVERQRPLSDDFWNLLGVVRARGRWLRAGELATIGAREIAQAMHHVLYGGDATPVPTP